MILSFSQLPSMLFCTGHALSATCGLHCVLQCVQAAQLTFEDYFMADLSVAPLKIVGVEGLFGSIIMVGALLPLVSVLPGEDGSGLHEDTLDTLHVCPEQCLGICHESPAEDQHMPDRHLSTDEARVPPCCLRSPSLISGTSLWGEQPITPCVL